MHFRRNHHAQRLIFQATLVLLVGAVTLFLPQTLRIRGTVSCSNCQFRSFCAPSPVFGVLRSSVSLGRRPPVVVGGVIEPCLLHCIGAATVFGPRATGGSGVMGGHDVIVKKKHVFEHDITRVRRMPTKVLCLRTCCNMNISWEVRGFAWTKSIYNAGLFFLVRPWPIDRKIRYFVKHRYQVADSTVCTFILRIIFTSHPASG